MRYSRTALKVLTARYRSVLQKCALINAGLLLFAAPAMAAVDVGNFNDFMTQWKSGGDEILNLTQDLTADKNIGQAGFTPITINGNGWNIDGAGNEGIHIANGQTLIINSVGDKNNPDSKGWHGFKRGYGSAIRNDGNLTISDSIFSGNTAGGAGGAISNHGNLTISASSFSENSGTYDVFGGAINNEGSLIITDSVFDRNSSTSVGGAIRNNGNLTISDSSFRGNSADTFGGAINNSNYNNPSSLVITGSTFSGNTANWGGAIYNDGNLTIIANQKDTVFTGNTAKGQSNALLNDGRNSRPATANLNAGSSRIVFNDGIDGGGADDNTININNSGVKMADGTTDAPTNGLVEFNNLVKNNTVNVYNGTLKLGTFAGGEVNGKMVEASSGNFDDSVKLNVYGGTLDIGTQHTQVGTALFDKGSMLAVTVNPNQHGIFSAQNLTVNNGATLRATLAQGLLDSAVGSKTFTLVSAENWVGATADNNGDNFMLAQDNNMYKFEKTDKAGEYLVTLVQTAGDASYQAGGTTNNSNTAGAWIDGGSFAKGSPEQALANKLAGLAQNDAHALNNALTALAPEAAPVVRAQAVDSSAQIFNVVSSRLSNGSLSSSQEGMSSGDTRQDRGAVWVQMIANKAKFDGNKSARGFDSKNAGVAMGAEKQFSDTIKAGLGYGYTNGEIDAFMRDIDVDTHTVFAYGEYKPSNWFLNAITSYSFADYDESKNVAGSHYHADYDVETLGLQAMTGYDMNVNGFGLTPSAGLRYNHIMRDAYRDTARQHVGKDSMDVLTAVAGAKVAKELWSENGTRWRPEARLAVTYDLVSDEEEAFVSLSNGSGYLIEGKRLDRFGIETGLGLTVDLSDALELNAGYEGKFREDYQDHTGLFNAKYKF